MVLYLHELGKGSRVGRINESPSAGKRSEDENSARALISSAFFPDRRLLRCFALLFCKQKLSEGTSERATEASRTFEISGLS
jgi:hypothetical protein